MPRDAAAVKRHAQITERQMQRMALQVVNQKCMACHAQTFAGEANNLIGLKMMQKKGAAYGVKTIVAKGKSQGIAADAGMDFAQVRWGAIKNDRLRSNA